MSGILNMFVGSIKPSYVFTATISANTTNYDLKSAAITAGWDQIQPLAATVTINSGVTVSSTSTGTPAFQTGTTFPSGSSLKLINNGTIIGRGGNGGNGGQGGGATAMTSGGSGGTAVSATAAISIDNGSGSILGGGGGGGGGRGGYILVCSAAETAGGGGGGGGRGNSSGGTGGSAAHPGSNGTGGTLTTAGSGGGVAGPAWSPPPGVGGNGGGAGSAGSTGGASGASGGAAGAAVSGDSNITWIATGTRTGPIS